MKEEKKCKCGPECKCGAECNCGGEMVYKKCHHHHNHGGAKCDGLYGLGVIGALFYFLHGVVGFGPVVLGIAKAFFWPAFAVFKLLGLLGVQI